MNVNVHSIHFDADAKLVEFIKEKINKLTQFHDGILAAEVYLKLASDGERPENKITEIRLEVPGNGLFAKRQAATFEEAAVGAVEALRNQVERGKTRTREVR
jgi:putative sigma-54 modulation protein